MRKRPGLAGLHRQQEQKEKFEAVGNNLDQSQMEFMQRKLQVFKDNLETFAMKHKAEINKDPRFRRQFHLMCAKCGVDPLASNQGFWGKVLGVGDFYYELSVQIIDICVSSREKNGGLITLSGVLHSVITADYTPTKCVEGIYRLFMFFLELLSILIKRRGKQAREISEDDVKRALKKVAPLGNSFSVSLLGNVEYVLSVPMELNTDHHSLIAQAVPDGFITAPSVLKSLGWTADRFQTVLNALLLEGMVWTDDQANPPRLWFTSIYYDMCSKANPLSDT